MLIDTHTHLYLPEFDNPEAAVDRAVDAGVGMMILPNVDATTLAPLEILHINRPEVTRTAIGLHPTEVDARPVAEQLGFLTDRLNGFPGLVAIGEVGIDLYWDKTFRLQQMEVLDAQLQIASERQLPVIIHCREGLSEVLDVVRNHKSALPQLLFHSFGGSIEDVERIRALTDAYFGINGIVTFKNSKLREVLPAIGIDRIVLETDAPYLAPVPHRGKRNESSFIIHTAGFVANAMGLSSEEIAETTTRNASALFNL